MRGAVVKSNSFESYSKVQAYPPGKALIKQGKAYFLLKCCPLKRFITLLQIGAHGQSASTSTLTPPPPLTHLYIISYPSFEAFNVMPLMT